MLYDGECSLCMKEVKFLMKRDAGAGKIDFVDIAAPSYQPSDNAGITFEQVMWGWLYFVRLLGARLLNCMTTGMSRHHLFGNIPL
jgi:hypothetical protein